MNILKFYRLKYTVLEILGYVYISPIIFLKKMVFVLKDRYSYTRNLKCSKTFDYLEQNIDLNKKTIVVIDNYIPEYDIHAGARTLFQYMQLYKNLGLDVVFIPDDYIKREPYTTELKDIGIQVLYGRWYKKNIEKWLLKNSKFISFVMLNRPRSIKYIDFFKKYINATIIYYGMDMYFIREYQRYLIEHKKEALRAYKYYKKIECKMYKAADVIFTVSLKEQEKIKKMFTNVNVIQIPCFFYKIFSRVKYNYSERENIMFVGGQKHPPNPDAVSWFCLKIFPKILEKNNSIKFYVVGNYSIDFINKYNNSSVIFTGKISDKELKNIYSSIRLSIIPLRYGAGVKGKTIEAMYYGVPIVSTNYGIEGLKEVDNFIEIVKDEKEFSDSVLKLYNNKEKLEAMSNKSFNYIKTNFSYDTASNIVKRILHK